MATSITMNIHLVQIISAAHPMATLVEVRLWEPIFDHAAIRTSPLHVRMLKFLWSYMRVLRARALAPLSAGSYLRAIAAS